VERNLVNNFSKKLLFISQLFQEIRNYLGYFQDKVISR